MNYNYVAYTADKRLVKGKLSASTEEIAANMLSYGGYQVVSLKQITPFLDTEKLASYFTKIKPKEVIMFSRQLALLLESGTDIVTALELLQSQMTNRTMKKTIGEIVVDIRNGSSLSVALNKHPRAFSQMYSRTIAAGEQGGNLEIVLRQMADFMERAADTEKRIKSALTYPFIVLVMAIVVVGILVTFVLPTFADLYSQLGANPPATTKLLIGLNDWVQDYGLYVLLVILAAIVAAYAYIRTPAGKYQWDRLFFRLPVIGRISLLFELSRCCRTISLLFKVGLPLPEIMTMAVQGSKNKTMKEALAEVQKELIRGEGLSKPMTKKPLFLPMMVQMVGVGEETGNLDNTLATVAQSYEAEADDRTNTAVELIQPAMTVVMGAAIAFIAISLIQAMYSIYGEFG